MPEATKLTIAATATKPTSNSPNKLPSTCTDSLKVLVIVIVGTVSVDIESAVAVVYIVVVEIVAVCVTEVDILVVTYVTSE